MSNKIDYLNHFYVPIVDRDIGCSVWYSESRCSNCGLIHDRHFTTFEEAIAAHNTVYVKRMILKAFKNIMKKKRR